MKAALFLAGIIACTGVAAQQAPAAATPTPRPVPPPAAPASARMNNEEMAELLRAQTSAIRALSAKIDALEIRLGNLETKQP